MKNSPVQSHVLRLAHPPIPTVHIGIIGLGNRGLLTLQRYLQIEGVEIKALCEIREGNLSKNLQQLLKEADRSEATGYTGVEGWKKMCESDEVDLIFICTDWLMHTPMATFAMECNKHVAIEVPAAMSVEECWQLVDTAEKTRRHCIMLENCCYDPFALMTLNIPTRIVRRNHACRRSLHSRSSFNVLCRRERRRLSQPLGKKIQHRTYRQSLSHSWVVLACQILDIHRSDRMEYLVSMSTHQAGMSEYARRLFGEYSPEAHQKYQLGDVNTTLIHTLKGKTIMLQYDISTPRPYSRLQTVCGTLGFAQKYPVPCIALDPNGDTPLEGELLEKMMARYKHPFNATIGEEAHRRGLPNEMNYVMDYRLIHCLRNGLPLDMDVYDAAEWSCITELSEKSVLNKSMAVEIPDFTRGAWKKYKY